MQFSFATVTLNCNNVLFGTSFFLIYLDLELGFENNLLKNIITFPADNEFWKLAIETIEQGVKYVQS